MLYYKVLNLISHILFLFHSAFLDIKFYEADINLWKCRENISNLFNILNLLKSSKYQFEKINSTYNYRELTVKLIW